MDSPQNYVDIVHFQSIVAIRDAFYNFNAYISDTGNGMYLEVPDITVLDETGAAFARVFYLDGEVFVEPLFDLIRNVNDR